MIWDFSFFTGLKYEVYGSKPSACQFVLKQKIFFWLARINIIRKNAVHALDQQFNLLLGLHIAIPYKPINANKS